MIFCFKNTEHSPSEQVFAPFTDFKKAQNLAQNQLQKHVDHA